MKAGELRQRGLFQKRVVTQDSFSQQLISWVDYLAGVPCKIEPLSGRELIAAQAANAEITHRITVRFHPLFVDPIANTSLRFVYQPSAGLFRYFNLHSSINLDERNRTIEFMATEGLSKQ